jgi:hypothetical protein
VEAATGKHEKRLEDFFIFDRFFYETLESLDIFV